MNCCDVKPGQLVTQITLYHTAKTKSDWGGFKRDLTQFSSPMARVRSLSGSRRDRGNFDDIRLKKEAVIRYRSDVLESDIVSIRGTQYRIANIDNVEMKNRWLKLELAEEVA